MGFLAQKAALGFGDEGQLLPTPRHLTDHCGTVFAGL